MPHAPVSRAFGSLPGRRRPRRRGRRPARTGILAIAVSLVVGIFGG